MLEPAGTGLPVSRAFLQVAGTTVAWHQMSLALTLDCRKILCLARALTAELIALQHAVEAAGAQFVVVTSPRQIVGQVTAADDVLVFADGLLASPQSIASLLDHGPTVLVQPIETGLSRGFERIDINHASAGVVRIPGHLVERLADLPSDCDAASSLTRLALQANVPQTMVPAALREESRWTLVRDEAAAHLVEASWIELTLQRDKAATPGAAAARLGVRAFGSALLHGGSGGNVVLAGAVLALFVALVAGWFGLIAPALLLLALAWVIRHAASLVMQVERARTLRPAREAVFGWMLDAAFVAVAAWSARSPEAAGPIDLASSVLAPVLLVCLLRILPRAFEQRWTAWLDDRALSFVLLAIPAAAGILPTTVQVLAVLAGLAGAIPASFRRPRAQD